MIEHTIYKEFIDKIQNYQTGYILSSPTWIMTYHTYRIRQLIFSALKPASIPASLNS